MAFDLDKQIGPFPLKTWLIIAVGGIGVGYLVSTRMSGGGLSDTTSGAKIAVPQSMGGNPYQDTAGQKALDTIANLTGQVGSLGSQITSLNATVANKTQGMVNQNLTAKANALAFKEQIAGQQVVIEHLVSQVVADRDHSGKAY